MSSDLFEFDNYQIFHESNALLNPIPMQRSYSFDHRSNLNNGSSQIRRVCSTGDLQEMKIDTALLLSPEKSESSFKVGRYTAEERKERIDRYRAKRTLRNFNKTIKYACRKTLADTRPRVRGRFARNDDMPKAPDMFHRYEDHHHHHLWMSMQIDGFLEEDDNGAV